MAADRNALAVETVVDANRAEGSSARAASSASLDSTLPPTPLRDLLAAEGAGVFVLSSDAALRRAVQRAAGEHYATHVIADPAELRGLVESGLARILLLDADALPAGVEAFVKELEECSGGLVMIVAAQQRDAESVIGLLAARRIHRLLMKPAAPEVTRLLLESAVGRYLEVRDAEIEAPAVVIERPPVRRQPRHARHRYPGPPSSPWWPATAIVALLMGLLLVGELSGGSWRGAVEAGWERALAAVSAGRSAPADAAPAAVPAAELVRLLTLVDTRLASGRLGSAVDDDGALYHFERAVRLNPHDPQVLRRREALAAALVDAARVELEQGNLVEAQRLADDAFALGAEREPLALFALDLEAARTARTFELHRALLERANARLRDGRLVARDGDDALLYLSTLRRERARLPGLAEAWGAFIAGASAGVRASIAAADWEAAEAWAAALEGQGAEPELAAALRHEYRQAQFLAEPAPAGTLRLIESVPLAYPREERRNAVEGWVDLEFVVDTNGRTRDVAVVGSQPRGRFEEAAIEHIERQRYASFVLDGRVYERRLQTRIRFEME
jgi:TonB family protein